MKKILFTILTFLLFIGGVGAISSAVPVEFESKATCNAVFDQVFVRTSITLKAPEVSSVSDIPLEISTGNAINLCNEETPTISFINQTAIDDVTAINLYIDNSDDATISDISGIEAFTNLTYLNLRHQNVVDLSPIKNLTKLEELDLGANSVVDVKPLADLVNLKKLYIQGNNITDISYLNKLVKLTTFQVGYNNISDISAVKNYKDLEVFIAGDNNIKDLSALKDLTKLKRLKLGDNYIYDISPLSGLVNLTELRLGSNYIKDISALKNITKLKNLCLSNNYIEDFSPLSGYADEDAYINIGVGVGEDLYLDSQYYKKYAKPGETITLPKIFSDIRTTTNFLFDTGAPIYQDSIFIEEDLNSKLTIKDTAIVGSAYVVRITAGKFSGSELEVQIIEDAENEFISEDGNKQVISDTPLDSELVLVVDDLTSELTEEDLEGIKNQDTSKTFLKAFEFYFQKGDDRVTPPNNSKYTVKIKLTGDLKNYENFRIGYFNPNTETIDEWYTGKIEGDYLVFDVLHFSEYAIYGTVKNPKTGDNINTYITMMLLSMAALVVASKKLKYNN